MKSISEKQENQKNRKVKDWYEIELEVKAGVCRIFVVINEIVITELSKTTDNTTTNTFVGAIDAKKAIENQDNICLWIYANEVGTTDYTNKDLFVNDIQTFSDEIENPEKQQNQIIVYPPQDIEAVVIDVPRFAKEKMEIPRVIFPYKEALMEKDILTLKKLGIENNRSKYACTFQHSKLSTADKELIGYHLFTAFWYGMFHKMKYTFPKNMKDVKEGLPEYLDLYEEF